MPRLPSRPTRGDYVFTFENGRPPDKAVPYHLRHADLVAHREQLASRHIILTHMSADMLGRTDDAAFDLAYDGRAVDL